VVTWSSGEGEYVHSIGATDCQEYRRGHRHYRGRDLNALLGRWLTRKPAELPEVWRLYEANALTEPLISRGSPVPFTLRTGGVLSSTLAPDEAIVDALGDGKCKMDYYIEGQQSGKKDDSKDTCYHYPEGSTPGHFTDIDSVIVYCTCKTDIKCEFYSWSFWYSGGQPSCANDCKEKFDCDPKLKVWTMGFPRFPDPDSESSDPEVIKSHWPGKCPPPPIP
jgi:hypothetical protein